MLRYGPEMTTDGGAGTPGEGTAGMFRTSIELPMDLAEYAQRRAGGDLSGYLTDLVADQRRREASRARPAEHA